MTEAPSVFDSGSSWERPRIIVRIKRSRLGNEFSKRLWKEYGGVGTIAKNRSAEIKGQDYPKIGEQQVDRAKFGGSSESNSDLNHDDSDGDDVGSIDSNEMASKTTHFKKTLIRIHRNAARECKSSKDSSASDSDAPYASEDEGMSVDHEEDSNDPRTDDENANDDMSSDQQEETTSICESISSSTASNVSGNSSNVDPNMSDSKPKIMVLDNTIIASPSRRSSTSSLPDQSIKSPLLEQNKSPTVGKHILPTVFIPQQQNSRVAVPLNHTTKSNPQPPKDKPNMEENRNPNYPNITVEIDTSNDDVKINRIIEQKPPSSIKGTVRRKSTIPVRRKYPMEDENQRKEIIFNKEMTDVLQELEEKSNIRQSGLELLSSVCATTRPAPQLTENVQVDLDRINARTTQIADVTSNGRHTQCPPIYNRSKSMPSIGISRNTPKDPAEQTIKIPDNIPGKDDVNSVKNGGNQQPLEDLTSIENSQKVVPPNETNSTRVPPMHPNQKYRSPTASWPIENIQINIDPISQSSMPFKEAPPEYKRFFSHQSSVTIPNPSLFRPYTRSVSSPSQYRNVENDHVNRIIKETNPHPVLQPHERFNHPTYIPDWHQQMLMSSNLVGNVMIPTNNVPTMPQMKVNATVADASTERIGPGRRHSPPQNDQIRKNTTDINPVRYPSPYFNPVPMHYPLPHPMFYNPPYILPHPIVVPKTPEENDQANMLAREINQRLFAQIQNQQLQQNLIMSRTTMENNQIRNENYQNMLAIYNTQTTVVSSHNALLPEDLTVECVTEDEQIPPPPYYSTHLVFDDSGEIIKEQSAIEISIIPRAELTYDQKQGKKAIEMMQTSPKQPHKEELPKSSPSNTSKLHNITSTTSADNQLRNKLQNDFLKKIQVFQKNLTSEQITIAFPKISYSNDFRLYPHIMQQLQDARVNAAKSPLTSSTTSGIYQPPPQQSPAYPLNSELLENLLQNEKPPLEKHHTNQSKPKTKTSSSKNEIDKNQICTLYYESQDGKGQTECTKQTIIFTETSTTEANLQSEVASSKNPSFRNMENYNTLIKLIDSLASTEYDRLLGRTLLQYYPNEVLEITMNRMQKQMSSDENVLHILRKAKQSNKRVGTKEAPEPAVMLPEVALNTSKLTVKTPELAVKTLELIPGTEETPIIPELVPKTLEALEIAESMSKTPEFISETASRVSEVTESTSEVPGSPSKLPSKSPELNISSNGCDRHMENLQNNETSKQLKGIPSSVIKQNPFAITTTKKVQDFACSSPPTIQSREDSINHENIEKSKLFTIKNQITSYTSSTEDNSKEHYEITLENEDIEDINIQNGGNSVKQGNSKFSIEDLTKNIDGNAKIGKVKTLHQDSTNRNSYQSVIVTPDPTTAIQNKMHEGYSKEELPAVNRVNVITDLLIKEKSTDEPEALDTVDRQSNENIGEEAKSGETIGSLDDISSTNHSSAFENTPEEPFAVLAIKDCSKEVTKEGSTSKEINSITATELPKPCNHGRPVPNNSDGKEIDENCNKQIESNTLQDSMKNHVTCAKNISTGFYIESAKSTATASLESNIEAVAIQEAIQVDNETYSGTSSEKSTRQDGANINFETSDTSPENSQPPSNSDVELLSQTPSEEVDAQTDSTDEEVKEFELKREAFQNGTKYLSHNFLFDIKIGPNDDIESIYARIMPSCFMILNLIHEMQNINSEANWWPIDSSGNLVKIKRSLRGISIFLKRSKKLATHLDTRIHHFFIFLLQCFGTFRERVRRILDNGYALKENYISTSEADIYRDVFIQLYDYLSCTRVTDYANIVIKREESMKKTKSNQTNSYQPTKPFPNVHQKYMLIIKQIKQRRDAEEEKNEDYKNFISHLLDNSQGLFEDDMNNNANIDDVIIIPDTEEVGTNAQNEPTLTTSIQRKSLKRKVDFIVIDSDSDEDTRRSQENFPAHKKHELRKNTNHAIANIINLVDEEEDISTSEENINQINHSNNSSNKRQSSGEYSETNKRICSSQELETPTNVKNQNEVQIFPNFLENEHPNEILEHMNETELKESKKQMEISQEFNESLSSLRPDSNRKEIKFEDDHSPMVFQLNHEDCTNSNVKNSPIFQNGSIDGLENQVTPELRMEVECAQEAKHIPNQSGNCVPDISELNAIEKSGVKSNSPLNAENREGSETIEAIQNYLRETDLNFQEIHSANAENGEETSLSAPRQVNIGTNSEARVIGVAMPNVKDIRCPNNAKPVSISSDNSVVECPKIISYSNEQNNDNDVKSIRDNLNKNLISESLKDKSDGTITQRLMNFRKPAKKQTNTLDIHSSKAPGNLEPPNRSPEPNHCLNLNLNNNKMLQHHEHATLQDLSNVEIKLTESGKNPSPKPENLESQPFQTIPNSKITPRDPRSKPPERPPLQIKARRISLETQGNDLIPNGRPHLNTRQAEDCDYLNTQAKAAISEYFDAQKIVARQIANPIQADAAIREFDSFRSPAPPEISKYKQIHPIKAPLAVPPPQSPQPLLPPPNSSKERLRQAVTKRQLSQMQQSAQTQPRSAPTPIPTLQSIYNDNIDTRGFISQYIKDEIGVLSKKESLGPGEYVLEVNTLKRLPLIPRDFKEFYIFVTKQQILQLHQPIAFYIFLELLNQSGLKDYHKKFTEYSKRKYEDRVNLKKREQTHHQHRHLQHQQQQQQQLRHRT